MIGVNIFLILSLLTLCIFIFFLLTKEKKYQKNKKILDFVKFYLNFEKRKKLLKQKFKTIILKTTPIFFFLWVLKNIKWSLIFLLGITIWIVIEWLKEKSFFELKKKLIENKKEDLNVFCFFVGFSLLCLGWIFLFLNLTKNVENFIPLVLGFSFPLLWDEILKTKERFLNLNYSFSKITKEGKEITEYFQFYSLAIVGAILIGKFLNLSTSTSLFFLVLPTLLSLSLAFSFGLTQNINSFKFLIIFFLLSATGIIGFSKSFSEVVNISFFKIFIFSFIGYFLSVIFAFLSQKRKEVLSFFLLIFVFLFCLKGWLLEVGVFIISFLSGGVIFLMRESLKKQKDKEFLFFSFQNQSEILFLTISSFLSFFLFFWFVFQNNLKKVLIGLIVGLIIFFYYYLKKHQMNFEKIIKGFLLFCWILLMIFG